MEAREKKPRIKVLKAQRVCITRRLGTKSQNPDYEAPPFFATINRKERKYESTAKACSRLIFAITRQ